MRKLDGKIKALTRSNESCLLKVAIREAIDVRCLTDDGIPYIPPMESVNL